MESLRNEINFRSRRGLQELDILLKRFLEKHLSNLEESSLKELIEILDMEDNDLADLLIYKTETPKEAHRAIIKKILSD
jgi:succinate dehydrogenase flavin-adding protein (antitoxin of CptAB toxin-antitoxin module)|tara:strand:- start:80 stop:316 length:237 start_codon:yes stop_codon:yes gene_type:complete